MATHPIRTQIVVVLLPESSSDSAGGRRQRLSSSPHSDLINPLGHLVQRSVLLSRNSPGAHPRRHWSTVAHLRSTCGQTEAGGLYPLKRVACSVVQSDSQLSQTSLEICVSGANCGRKVSS